MNHDQTFVEKIALLALAGLCIISLTWIAIKALSTGTVDSNAATLIGVIAAGLIAFGKDIVAAIRSYAMSAQLGKVTDQLAAAAPVPPPVSEGAAVAANEVADAAVNRAEDFKP